jgi:hypothetical protein
MFEHFWKILKPNGELLIQCGGYGEFEKTFSIFNKVRKSKEFYNYFCNDKGEERTLGVDHGILLKKKIQKKC